MRVKLKDQVAALKAQVADLQKELDIVQRHNAYDMSCLKTDYRVFLTQRITPLLNDAIDAIEIEVPEIALCRIRNVLRISKERAAEIRETQSVTQ